MVIQIEEWTFGKDLRLAFPDDNYPDDAAESAPTFYAFHPGVEVGSLGRYWMFPTGSTIGGQGVQGFDEGLLTFWTLVRTFNGAICRVAFRRTTALTNATSFPSADLTAYVLSFTGYVGGRLTVERWNIGAVAETLLNIPFPAGFSPGDLWCQHRIRWYVESGALKITYENRRSASNPFRQVGPIVSDATNSFTSPTNKIGFYLGPNLRLEGIRLSPNV